MVEGNAVRDRLIEADDVGGALALLTRLPAPPHESRGARAAWAWPLAGAIVGALAAAAAATALALELGPGIAAALALGTQAIVTGALHEDGLADSADGLWGGGTAEKRLAIMKDSRIGTYGALALMFGVLLRWQALSLILTETGPWGTLIAVGALSRWPMAAILYALPPAREGGLSRLVGRTPGATLAAASGMALVVGIVATGWTAFTLAVAVIAVTAFWAALAGRRLGGQTGDICGASQQTAEVAILLTLVAV